MDALPPTAPHPSATPLPESDRPGQASPTDQETPSREPSRVRGLSPGEGRSRPLVVWLTRTVLRLGSFVPISLMQALGTLIGMSIGSLPTRSRVRSLANLELCLPELSPSERRRLARRGLVSISCMGLELPALWGWSKDRLLGLVREVRGWDQLEAAMAEGRGVVLAMPHMGAWELAGIYCSAHFPMTALYRPSRTRELNKVLCEGRERLGGDSVPVSLGAVRCLRIALKRGELTMIMPDTDPKLGASVFARLFGVPANTSTLLPRLVRDSNAVVVMCHAERLGIGRGFRLHFRRGSHEMGADDPVVAATAMNREIEAEIRAAPQQYLWRYRRFRRRPNGSPPVYAGVTRFPVLPI